MNNDYIKKTLSNGVVVYLYADPNCKRTHISYSVKYGSFGYYDTFYYEGKKYHMNPGMAHFLEHTLIEHAEDGNMLHYFMDKGYSFNGLTYPELTSYFIRGIGDMNEDIKKLIRMVDVPAFTKENTETVKSAICEELKNGDDNKYRLALNSNRRNTFSNFDAYHGSLNTLGTVETTKNITYEDALTAYNAYYNDENKFLVIGGNIDIDKTVNYLEEIYKDIKPHPNKLKEEVYPDNFKVRTDKEYIVKPGDSDYVIKTYKIKNNLDNTKWERQDLLLRLFFRLKLGGDKPFIKEMQKARIIVGGIGYSEDFFKDSIAISFDTDSYDEKKFLEKTDSIFDTNGLDVNELELIKKHFIVNEIKSKDFIYNNFAHFPLGIDFSEHMSSIDLIKSVTLEEIIEYINSLDLSNSTTTVVTNKKMN